jgi:preprotein translocase subunit SecB
VPSTPATTRLNQPDQPGIAIAQIFLEKLSFEHRGDPMALPPNTPPNVGELNVEVEIGLAQDRSAGITRITVSTDVKKEPVYNVRLTITGLFTKTNADGGMPMETFLHNNSLSLMYPFVREAFAAITQRGRFGPVWLDPFNTLALKQGLSEAPEGPSKE